MIFIVIVLVMVASFSIISLVSSIISNRENKGQHKIDTIESIYENLSTCANKSNKNLLGVICEQSKLILEEKKEKQRIVLLTQIVDEIRYDDMDMFLNLSDNASFVSKYNYSSFLSYINALIPNISSYTFYSESVKKLIDYTIDFLKIPDNKGRFEDLVCRIEALTKYYVNLDSDVNLEYTVALVRKITRLTIKNSKKEINIIDYAIIKSSTRNREWKKIKEYIFPYFLLRGKLIYDAKNTVYNN